MHEYEGQQVIISWCREGDAPTVLCGLLEKYEHVKREPLEVRTHPQVTHSINQDSYLLTVDGDEHELKPPFTVMRNPERPHAHRHECYGPRPTPPTPQS